GVGRGSLATHGQAAQVANAPIALNALQALEVQTELASQVTFDHIFAILNGVDDLRKLLLVQVLRAQGRIDLRFGENVERVGRTNAVNIAQRDVDALFAWNFNTNDTCHKY